MKTFEISVKDKIAALTNREMYVCGNSDFVVDFSFDAEWDAFDTKTARFAYKGTYQDQVFQGTQCQVPIIHDAHIIMVGVFAGNLHTTTAACITARRSILSGSGVPADPAPDVYAQIMELIQGLGEPDPETIAAAVADYIRNNPIAETDPTVPAWAKAENKPEYTAEEVGALSADALPGAIDQALAQAKESGEFDGAPGKDGADGQPGVDGADGVGIQSVVQTTTSTEDGGTNVVTVTKTDGTSSTFYFKNGSKGSTGPAGADGADGAPGADGYTPVKGTDYFTEADKQEITEQAAGLVSIPDKLPNPNALTFTGAVTGSYDGSAPLSVEIPQGGGGGSVETYTGEYELIVDHTVTAEEASASSFTFTKDAYPLINGQKLLVFVISKPASVSTPWFDLIAGSTTVCKFSNGTSQYFRGLSIVFYNRWLSSNENITNKQYSTYLRPSVVLVSDYGPSYQSKPYQHYTSIKISSYMAFLEEGTVIKIYGGK